MKTKQHNALTLWLTGLSGAGKSTIAYTLQQQLTKLNVHSFVLDGDVLRDGLNYDLGFSPQDRQENIRRVNEVAMILNQANVIAIVGTISPYKADRKSAQEKHHKKSLDFWEIFIDATLDVCEQRDPKGLYAKARAGEILSFTGIDAPYEKPEHPTIHIDTSESSVQTCVDQVLKALEKEGCIQHNFYQETV